MEKDRDPKTHTEVRVEPPDARPYNGPDGDRKEDENGKDENEGTKAGDDKADNDSGSVGVKKKGSRIRTMINRVRSLHF